MGLIYTEEWKKPVLCSALTPDLSHPTWPPRFQSNVQWKQIKPRFLNGLEKALLDLAFVIWPALTLGYSPSTGKWFDSLKTTLFLPASLACLLIGRTVSHFPPLCSLLVFL